MVDLPAPDKPVNHNTHGFWLGERGARLLVHIDGLPVDVGGAPQGEVDDAHADGAVGEAVDDDEAAEVAVLAVGGERHRLAEIEIAHADLVQFEGLGGDVLQGVDVDLVFGVLEGPAIDRAPSLIT